jgi:hypothetical protein
MAEINDMEKTKFTVRVETDALKRARSYATRHGTNLTRLINEYLRTLGKTHDSETPILDELAGTLQLEQDQEAYHRYLEYKYLEMEKPNARPN